MRRRTALAGIAGTSSLLAIAAMISPMVTNAATPTSHTPMSVSAVISQPGAATTAQGSTKRVTSTRARALVLSQVPGGHVTDVRGTRHGGYEAFAVKVTRPNGSILTGYVDRDSGIVFDWKQAAAPAVTTTVSPSSAGSDDADVEDVNDQQGDSDDQDGAYSDDQGEDDNQQGEQEDD